MTRFDLWDVVAAVSVIVVLLAVTESGFRRGRARTRGSHKPVQSIVSSVVAAMLGLVGLLLAFSLSMAETRFTARRQMITAEANAIGTAWLRAGLLDPTASAESRMLLVRYTDERLAFYDTGANRSATNAAIASAALLQRRLWVHAEEAGQRSPTPVTALFIASLNDVFDRGTDREALLDDRVPLSLKFTVILAALVACGSTGFSTGLTTRRDILSMIVVPLMLGIGIVTTLDLDQPRSGLIRTGQTVMIHLRENLRAQTPGS